MPARTLSTAISAVQPPSSVTLGSGPDLITLILAEDAYAFGGQTDAQFTVSVDGVQIGGAQTVTALRAQGQTQAFYLQGAFGTGPHALTVSFLNDAYGGSPSLDRNLYVESIGTASNPSTPYDAELNATQSLTFGVDTPVVTGPATIGVGPDSFVLNISEDAYQGDALFAITVDGVQVGTIERATAIHGSGQSQAFTVEGNFGSAPHVIGVDFLNDAYNGSPSTDRNLYVDAIQSGTQSYGGGTLDGQGTQFFYPIQSFTPVPATTLGSGPDTITLNVAEDAYTFGGQTNAQFTLSVDGVQIGGIQTATALRSLGQSQAFFLQGAFGTGPHALTVSFLNDAYGGSPSLDRNLYVESIGTKANPSTPYDAELNATQSLTFGVNTPVVTGPATIGTGPDNFVLSISEDAYLGDALFAVTVDGVQIGLIEKATAIHGRGQTQAFTVQGNFGTGSHVVGVDFLNDAYDFTPSTDRNLYVDALQSGSQSYAGRALDGQGTQFFTIQTQHGSTMNGPPPVLSAALTDDTGVSTTDGVTTDATIGGTVTAAAGLVSLTGAVDGTGPSDITAAVASNGAFTLTPVIVAQLDGGTLPQGGHTLHLVATDLAGHTAAKDVAFTLQPSMLAPTITLAAGDQVGTPSAPAARVGNVTLVGTATAGDTVTIVEPGSTVTTVAAPNGTYTVANVSIALGSNAFSVSETNTAGGTGGANTTITGQAPPPAPVLTAALTDDTGVSATDGVTTDATIGGTVMAAAGLVSLTGAIDATSPADITVDVTGRGSFALTPAILAQLDGGTLPLGGHTLHLVATDMAGHTAAKDVAFTLQPSSLAPTIALSAADQRGTGAAPAARVGNVTLVGTATAGDTVTIGEPGKTVTTVAAANGTFSVTNVPIALGSNTFSVSDTNTAGGTGSANTVITGQAPPPGPVLAAALSDDTGLSASDGLTTDATIGGTVTAAAGLASLTGAVDGTASADITADVGSNGAFTLTPALVAQLDGGTLPLGSHTLHLVATDSAGHTAAQDVSFTLAPGSLAPTIALATSDQLGSAMAPAATAGVVTVVGYATAGDTVTLVAPGGSMTTIAAANNSYTVANVSLTSGSNSLSVSETNAAGGTGSASTVITGQAPATGSDVVLTWVNITRNAIALDADAPTVASRTLALESLSVYDTLAAVNGTSSFAVTMSAPADANVTAALASAADATLDQLYPTQAASFDGMLAMQLAALPDGQGKTDGVALGRAIAVREVALRATDGSNANITDYGSDTPGQWRPTPYGYAAATTPQYASVTPFLLTSPAQFRDPPPPALTSQAYADALNQVESLGEAVSTTRTADETQIAKFWNGQTGTDTPAGEWNNIAGTVAQAAGDSVAQDARLFAELNVTLADATITAWNNKFYYNFWRPVTAIRDANQDGNPATTANQTWTSLLSTPAFPDYAEGHGTISAAAAAVLGNVFGDTTSFTVSSMSTPTVSRSFTSFSDAASEAAESRIYGGIHFQFSADAGLAIGAQVGAYDVAAFSLASDTPPLVRLDPALPTITDTSPAIDGQVTSKYGATALQASLDGGAFGAVALTSDGSFDVIPSLATDGSADGVHTVTLVASDPTGLLSGPVQYQFILATQAPTITLASASVQSGGIIDDGVVLAGSITPEAGDQVVRITYGFDGAQGGTISPETASAFSQMLDLTRLSPGAHELSLTVTDASGLVTTDTLDVTFAPGAFTLVAVTPVARQTEVGVTYRPEIKFSRPVDPATITSASFYATDSAGVVQTATIVVNQDGSAARLLFNSPAMGGSTITLHVQGELIRAAGDGGLLDAAGTGIPGSDLRESYVTVSTTAVPGTTLTGIVVDPGPDGVPYSPDDLQSAPDGTNDWAGDHWRLPLANVKVYILGMEDQAVYTDADGRFTLTNVPTGDVKVAIEGRTASNPPAGYFFPQLVSDVQITPGVVNTLAADMGSAEEKLANVGNPSIYLPRVATDSMTPLSSTGVTVVHAPTDASLGAGTFTLTPAQLASISLQVAPNSLLDANGNPVANPVVGLSPVPSAIVQDMLPPGVLQHTFDLTIQAGDGAVFTQGAILTLPNVFGLSPGDKTYMLDFDHTTGRLEVQGTATVSADGLTVTSDPGFGVLAPGWHAVTAKLTHAKGGVDGPCPPDNGAIANAQIAVADNTANYTSDVLGGLQTLATANETLLKAAPINSVVGNVANGAGVYLDGRTLLRDASQNFADARKDGLFSLSSLIFVTQGLGDAANLTLSTVGAIGAKIPIIGTEVATVASVGRGASGIVSLITNDGDALTESISNLSNTQKANPCPPASSAPMAQSFAMPAALSASGAMATPASPVAPSPLTGDISADIAAAQAEAVLLNQIAADAAVLAPIDALDFTRSDLGLTTAQNAALATNLAAFQTAYTDMLTKALAVSQMPTLEALALDIYQSAGSQTNSIISLASVDLQQYVADLNIAESDTFAYAHACDNALPGTVCAPDPGLLVQARHFQALSDAGFASIGGLYAPLYAALQGPDGNVQRFNFNYQSGIDYFLTPNTAYALTVFDPAANKIGVVSFVSSSTGTDTKLPQVTLFADTGAAGVDGLSNRAAFVTGLDNTKTGNIVGGISDLAALQMGGAAVTLATKTGAVASLTLPGTAQALALAGNLNDPTIQTAFVALGSSGLAVVNVSSLLSPVLLGSVATGGTAVDVAYDDLTGRVAVADTVNLAIVDVTTGKPMLIDTLGIAATRVLAVNGLAYAAVGGSIDVVDLSAGIVLQRLVLGATITGLAREGHYLYSIDAGDTLRVLDLDTSRLVQVGSVQVPAGGNRLTVGNGVAYVGNANGTFTGGFATVDVSNVAKPALIAGPSDNSIASAAIALAGPGTAIGVQSFSIGGPPTGAVDVLNTANSGNTGNRDTRYTLTGQQALDVKIGDGVAFVADGTGLDVINYIAADTTGVAPTVSITQPPVDVDPVTAGIQAYEGEAITLGVTASDNVQVRNTELLVNGSVVENAVSYPFSLGTVLPTIAANGGTSVTLQVETFDTGGNATMSAPLTVQLVTDTRPLELLSQSVQNGAHLGMSLRDITFMFSKPLAASVALGMPVMITAPDGTAVMDAAALMQGGRVLEVDFTPTMLGAYTVQLDGTMVQDASGHQTAASETFGFTVQAFSDTFINTPGGDWNTAANWSAGRVPGATDSAFIGSDIAGAVTYTSGTGSVGGLTMDQAALLNVTGGSLDLTDASFLGGVTLAGGSLLVDAASSIVTLQETGGALGGAGALTVTGDYTWSGGITSGTGTVLVAPTATIEVTGSVALGSGLTVAGQGTIGGSLSLGSGTPGGLTIAAGGVVTLQSGRVYSDGEAGDTLVDHGTLSAGAESVLSNVLLDAAGGLVSVAGTLDLQSTQVAGGTLTTTGGGTIQTVDRGSTLQNVAITAGSTVTDANNTSLTIAGTLSNAGTLQLASVGNYTALIASGSAVLAGTGTVALSDNFENRLVSNGVAASFTNQQTITGAGRLGDGDSNFTFINRGTVNATGSNALDLNTYTNTVTNSGTLEDTGAGGLLIQGTTVDSSASGVIQAVGAGAHVDLQTAAIIGGMLTTTGGGTIQTVDRGSALQNVAITAGSTVTVSNNTSLTIAGTLSNAGTLQLASVANYTALVASGSAVLTGAGTIALSDNFENRLVSNGTTASFTNQQTVTGAGRLGDTDGNFTFINQGLVNATGTNVLNLNTATNTVLNSGTLEDTASGGLLIQGTTVDGSAGGVIQAVGAGAHVDLQSATIIGGSLLTSGGGVIQTVDRGSVLRGSYLGAGSQILVLNNTSLTLQDALSAQATVQLGSVGNYTALNIAGLVTLTAGSLVSLSDNFENRIIGNAAATLTNAGLIQGAGRLGDGSTQLSFVNGPGGVINANGGNAIQVNVGGGTFANSGLLEATNSGGLSIYGSTLDDSGNGNAGKLLASGANAHVDLQTATIIGGTVTTTGGGTVQTVDRGSTLQNAAITAGSTVTVSNNTSLTIAGTLSNAGTLQLTSVGNYTALVASGSAVLTGAGTIALSDNFENRLVSNGTAALFTNRQTITGAGRLGDGDGNFNFINVGLVNATGTNALYLNTATNTVLNTGTLEDTGAGGLLIQGTTVNNAASGVIQAVGAGSHVDLQSATIAGGSLLTSGGGVIQTVDRGSVLRGSNLGAGSQVLVLNNTSLTLQDALSAQATVQLGSVGNYTALNIAGLVTLTAGSLVSLSDNFENRIIGNAAATLTNAGLIQGAGRLGDGSTQLSFVNGPGGVINANGGNAIQVNVGGGTFANSGLLEATGGGGISIYASTLDDSGNGNTGRLLASGANAHVDLQTATIIGGTLTTTGGGTIQTVDRGSTLQNVAITAGSTVTDTNNNFLTIAGTLSNAGTLQLASVGNYTALIASGNAVLAGTGTIALSDNFENRLVSNGAAASFTNQQTITGAGRLGDGDSNFTFINHGLVNASGGNAIAVNTSANIVTNSGTLEDTGTGGLLIQGSTVDQRTGGIIQSVGAGTHVDLATATIIGGTLTTAGGGFFQTTDRGTVLQNVAITAGSTVVDTNNNFLTIAGTLSNAGTLQLASVGNYTALIASGSAVLAGTGTVALGDNFENRLVSNGTTASFTNQETITGAGRIGDNDGNFTFINQGLVNASGGNALAVNTSASTVTNSGTFEATGSGGLTVSGALLNNGLVWGNGGMAFIGGAITGTGQERLSGASSLEIASSASAGQVASFDAGATGTLQLDQSAQFLGSIAGLSTTGANRLDLTDIASGQAKASFSGTASSGTLQVTDGSHTANLALSGNYLNAAVKLTADAGGHTLVSFG